MTNPDLGAILRRLQVLTVVVLLPTTAVLWSAGRREWAEGLLFGALVALLNAGILVRRINVAAGTERATAQRIMHHGMGIRFTLVMLATIVMVYRIPASMPGFVLGLLTVMALTVSVAARALLLAAQTAPLVTTGAVRTAPAAAVPAGVTASWKGVRDLSPRALTTSERSRLP